MFCLLHNSIKSHLLVALLITPFIATADADKLSLSGFVGIGGVYATDNNFLGSNVNGRTLVDAGIQARYSFSDNVSVTGQVTYRRLGEITTDAEPRVDFASIDIYSQLFGETQLSIGRIKPSTGLYTESRDLPMSRPSIIMPQSIYSDFFRDFLISFDGARVSVNYPLNWATISFESAMGKTQIDRNFNQALLGEASTGEWESDIAKTLDIKLSTDYLTFNVSKFWTATDYTPGEGNALPTVLPTLFIPLSKGVLEIDTTTAGVQYSNGSTELTFEYITRDNEIIDFVPSTESVTEGWYSQIRQSLSRDFTVTARYEVFYRNKKNREGSTTPPYIFPDYANTARTTSLSLSWQISPNLQATSEVHYMEGSGWLAPYVAPFAESFEKKHWMLFATQVTYRF
ncbi:hypothetical protein [Glaciecola sp. KUL10]|uniref:hypothetical protein n=1 Tax=Glaciecola sp. (strain KUL10) TaxID=2161813 RepID=UPI000D78847F|nr:hypothetical protein [Glaciecola sp. KUL10]GBL05015.1 hypothetical protein KUL10_23330 [Glaciecola sp. KUL10]